MSEYRITSRAIIIKNNKILLNEFNDGEYYNIPGGGVKKDETLRHAVEREVLEESGYTVTSKDLIFIYEYNPIRDGHRYGDRGGLSQVFRCDIDASIPRQKPSEADHDPDKSDTVNTGAKWIDLKELLNINLVPKINQSIIDYIKSNNTELLFLEDIH